jgi:hypothetical protein
MSSESESGLVVRHVREVAARKEQRWLVRSLCASGVGIIGGIPKSYKTWVATELAYAVATGRKAIGCFDVVETGPVLLFFAEDDLPSMRARFADIAHARGGDLDAAPVHFIDAPVLFLDDPRQLRSLRAAIDALKPRLLILDPFVRLVRRSDENSAQEVSAILGSLREIQRTFDVAIVLVHHMRKASSAHVSQQLRGSGDFSAWADSAIYITRNGEDRLLTVEHRAAAPPPPFSVRLLEAPAPHLVVVEATTPRSGDASLADAILDRLKSAPRAQSTVALRNVLKVRKAALVASLETLERRNLVTRTSAGWRIVLAR